MHLWYFSNVSSTTAPQIPLSFSKSSFKPKEMGNTQQWKSRHQTLSSISSNLVSGIAWKPSSAVCLWVLWMAHFWFCWLVFWGSSSQVECNNLDLTDPDCREYMRVKEIHKWWLVWKTKCAKDGFRPKSGSTICLIFLLFGVFYMCFTAVN